MVAIFSLWYFRDKRRETNNDDGDGDNLKNLALVNNYSLDDFFFFLFS